MNKIEFKDLPDTTTPLNATNLNTLQDNVETAINGILESGSNANGSYIKFSDGTMVCYSTQLFSNVNCSTAWGNIYSNSNDKRNFNNFPVSFVDEPIVTMRLATGNADGWIMSANINGGPSTTNPGGWQMCRATSNSSCNIYVSYIAIGKWK